MRMFRWVSGSHLPRSRRALVGLGFAIALVVALVAALSLLSAPMARAKACLRYSARQAALARFARTPATAPTPDFSHVVVILMENKECSQVVGSPQAPYVNGLARRYAVLRDLYATTHPSFPNYVALTSGSTLGATGTCARCRYVQ